MDQIATLILILVSGVAILTLAAQEIALFFTRRRNTARLAEFGAKYSTISSAEPANSKLYLQETLDSLNETPGVLNWPESLYRRVRRASLCDHPRHIPVGGELGNGWRLTGATLIPGTPFVGVELCLIELGTAIRSWSARLDFEKGVLLDEPFDAVPSDSLRELRRVIEVYTGE